MAPLFKLVLGEAFERLPQPVRALHFPRGKTRFAGLAQVEAADHWIGALLARLFRFPHAGRNIPVEVTIASETSTEVWHRRFGESVFSSVLTIDTHTGRCIEQFGALRFILSIDGHEHGLDMRIIKANWGIFPLPRRLLPWTQAFERVDAAGRFTFDVEIGLRGIGRLVRYRGWLSA